MGIDHTPILIFGTTDENIWKKLPEKIQNVYGASFSDHPMHEELGDLTDEFLEEDAEEYLGKELYGEFKDIQFWINGMCDNAKEGFEGLGVELDPKNRTINSRVRKKVEEVFKKYDLGEPKVQNFVHTW